MSQGPIILGSSGHEPEKYDIGKVGAIILTADAQLFHTDNSGDTYSCCDECKTWGKSIDPMRHPHAVQCAKCKRYTYPNLGVNLPAGAAVSLGTARNALVTYENMMKDASENRKSLLKQSLSKKSRDTWGKTMFKALHKGSQKRKGKK